MYEEEEPGRPLYPPPPPPPPYAPDDSIYGPREKGPEPGWWKFWRKRAADA